MLPAWLSERVEPGAPPPRKEGAFVLCWLRLAARAHENPALEVALAAARALRRPLFVYQGLSWREPHASDRLHTFALQGARQLHRDLRARGVGSAFHLERPEDGPALLELAAEAALVVADFMPVEHLLRLDQAAAAAAPLWRVDASCVAPVWALGPFERAFAFREAARPLWEARLQRTLEAQDAPGPPFVPRLPFEPVDLERADLAALVAACPIDHGVSPVHHTPGGAEAGLARWRRFAEEGLDAYHLRRRDPLLEGTSRLSAYLHFGHLSPFAVAREASARRTDGAAAYLDELLTWRELAWNLCRHRADVRSPAALPAWARSTLRHHQADARPPRPSHEQLMRGTTGEPLWDAAQRQLLIHGELHPSVRMTWGKALLPWTRSPEEALATLFELNDRHALDGRDPASAAGILWCLGSLDRPFAPEAPVLGAVRPRPLAEQAARFDVGEYARRTRHPSGGRTLAVAVVGAGVAGAAAARTLADAGHAVTLFDKGRGPGGRASTRRLEALRFDHGAPCFTVRDERFARWARAFFTAGVVARWRPRLASPLEPEPVWLVGAPGMSALVSHLQRGLDVRFGVEVEAVERDGGLWRLEARGGAALGEYDALVMALPAPQAARLVEAADADLAARLRLVAMAPCWAVMAAFAEPLAVPWDAAEEAEGPLRFMARDSSKPGRAPGERWVLHASAAWTAQRLEAPPDAVAEELLAAFLARAEAGPAAPTALVAHRWRHAFTPAPAGEGCFTGQRGDLVACGDWCVDGRLEGAFLSGVAAAGRLLGRPSAPAPEGGPRPARPPAQLRLLD